MPDDIDDPKDLRTKLEAANKRARAAEERATIAEAGLTHLTDRQRRNIMRDMRDENMDITADNFKKVAKELGWDDAPEAQTQTQTQADTGQQQGQQTNSDDNLGKVLLGDGTWASADDLRRIAMAAQMQAQSGSTNTADDGSVMTPELFNRQLEQIKQGTYATPDEGMAAVMQHVQRYGHVVKIMDGSLVD